jgi:hypothetical protein
MAQLLHSLAKLLEGVGLIVILVGLVMSVQLGMRDDGLESMTSEAYGLAIGGGMFLAGWLLERALGARG